VRDAPLRLLGVPAQVLSVSALGAAAAITAIVLNLTT